MFHDKVLKTVQGQVFPSLPKQQHFSVMRGWLAVKAFISGG
jgi:hypothetical protein